MVEAVEMAVESVRPGRCRTGLPLEVRLLGPLAIRRGGAALALPASRKVRALFAYLALTPRAVARSQLCELLWDVPNDPRGELRWCLSKIRRLVDEPERRRVAAEADAVRLDLAGCRVDALEIARAFQSGGERLAAARLRGLAALFKGDLLDGLESPRTPAFASWLAAQRRRFRDWRVGLIEQLVDSAHDDEALGHLETWLELAPFELRVHERVLGLLARRGRIREGEEHLAATARLFEAEGLDCAALHAAWRDARACRPGSPAAEAARSVEPTASYAAVLTRPAIVILPFANLSDDAAQEYFADGMTEELITALSHWRWFPVIAHNSTFAYKGRAADGRRIGRELNARYVLEGRVRRAGDRVRITARLLDAGDGHHVWAQTYERRLGDVFALQDEITRAIVQALEPQLARAEQQRALRKRPERLDAWDLSLRALFCLRKGNREDLAAAQALLADATRKDPAASYAQSLIALCRFTDALGGWDANPSGALVSTLAAAREAVALDGSDWLAHALLGIALMWTERQYDRAIAEEETALSLNPSGSLSHQFAGCVLGLAGEPEAAIPHLKAVLQLDPHYQTLASVLADLGLAHFQMGELDEALAWFDRAIDRRPDHVRAWQRKAACLGCMGREPEAAATLAGLLRLQPDFSPDYVRATYPFRAPAHGQMFVEGLRRAGWRA